MDIKNAQHIDNPEDLIRELKNNPEQKAWNVDPYRSPGYVVWYNKNGQCMSCMTVQDNRETNNRKENWGNFENFSKQQAKYVPSSGKIKYGDGTGSIDVSPRDDNNLIQEIKDNEGRSQLIRFSESIVGDLITK